MTPENINDMTALDVANQWIDWLKEELPAPKNTIWVIEITPKGLKPRTVTKQELAEIGLNE